MRPVISAGDEANDGGRPEEHALGTEDRGQARGEVDTGDDHRGGGVGARRLGRPSMASVLDAGRAPVPAHAAEEDEQAGNQEVGAEQGRPPGKVMISWTSTFWFAPEEESTKERIADGAWWMNAFFGGLGRATGAPSRSR
ncbi:MAG: hypothetical protein U5Q44_11865 [Dehalococcoidia bacterium]|nr:hypothetical protein [Dehalococcoidia bacterium]